MRQKREDYPLRVELLQTALEMYLTHGFTLTTNQMIADKVGCSTGQITNFFRSKENILYEVVRKVLPFHQVTLAHSAQEEKSTAVRYCMEIAMQIAFCENLDTVRDLYVNAYTLPRTLGFIREYSYKKSVDLFAERLPGWTEQDFYETEALTMGIVYGGLMDRCNPRYPLTQKLRRVLDALLKMYEYTEEERKDVIEIVLDRDIEKLAEEAEAEMRRQVRESIHPSDKKSKNAKKVG